MTPEERCPRCDRPKEGPGSHVVHYQTGECIDYAVDWRARALAAETTLAERTRERDEHRRCYNVDRATIAELRAERHVAESQLVEALALAGTSANEARGLRAENARLRALVVEAIVELEGAIEYVPQADRQRFGHREAVAELKARLAELRRDGRPVDPPIDGPRGPAG